MKFSVVPDSSLRKNTLIAVLGSVTPGLTLAIAGSFQVVIWPLKILAMTSGVRMSLSTPFSLYATAIGPVTIGRFQAGDPQLLVGGGLLDDAVLHLRLQRGVGPGEVDLAGDELLDARRRTRSGCS